MRRSIKTNRLLQFFFHHTQLITIMIRESLPSPSSSSIYPRLPLLSVFLVAAVLTALGAISHSTVRVLYPTSGPEDSPIFSNRIGRKSYQKQSSFLDATPKFQRTKYTFDSFVVAGGIDLAGFGLDHDDGGDDDTSPKYSPPLQYDNHELSFVFELFEDFDLSHRLGGNETWIELLEYRRDATHPSLSFYVDKVAFKRWLETFYADLNIDGIRSFLLRYASELHRDLGLVSHDATSHNSNISTLQQQAQTTTTTKSMEQTLVAQELLRWLPADLDYAAKPTHLSCSGGVWLVHNDLATNTTYVGNGKKKMKAYVAGGSTTIPPTDKQSKTKHKKDEISRNHYHSGGTAIVSTSDDPRHEIAEDLSFNLQKVQEKCGRTVLESYALRHVRPGIVVEERFTQPIKGIERAGETNGRDMNDDEDGAFLKGGMEFKVFTIWGRAWLIVWRPGMDGVKALFFRNGTNLVFDPPVTKIKSKQKPTITKEPDEIPSLPEWIDWDKVISIGETMGRHKDMFRTDIFVGVAIGTDVSKNGNNDDDPTPIRYVVSETEIHPTPLRGFETVFEEAGRLWLAGYYMLSRRSALSVVPNTEVPMTFYNNRDDAR